MLATEQYSISKTNNENNYSTLACDGRVLDLEVQGVILEAQFKLEDGSTLIWLTEDSPYDEGLHVYLIDENNNILDALETNSIFTPGILKITKTGKNWVEFEFFSNDSIYRLEVKKMASFRMSLPRGWKYKSLLKLHQLTISKT